MIMIEQGALGCQPISWVPRPTKSDPAPPVPMTDPLLTELAGQPERLVVVAVYPFTAIEPGDLSLVKGEQYVVLDDSQVGFAFVERGISTKLKVL